MTIHALYISPANGKHRLHTVPEAIAHMGVVAEEIVANMQKIRLGRP